MKLSEYDFDIIYRPGIKHQNADALSRAPLPTDNELLSYLREDIMNVSLEDENDMTIQDYINFNHFMAVVGLYEDDLDADGIIASMATTISQPSTPSSPFPSTTNENHPPPLLIRKEFISSVAEVIDEPRDDVAPD